MTDAQPILADDQLRVLHVALGRGADDASEALGRWIGRPATITSDEIDQCSIDEATEVLGTSDEPICFCTTALHGRITGRLIFAFDDAGGLALADMLLGQPVGTASTWGEMETSAALETTNILVCAYLNSVLRALPATAGEPDELMPSPPTFARDFAQSLLEFALMDQAVASSRVLLAKTTFRIDGEPVDWSLLLVPDAASMAHLDDLLGAADKGAAGASKP